MLEGKHIIASNCHTLHGFILGLRPFAQAFLKLAHEFRLLG